MNPSARKSDVVVQDVGQETIVYDRLRDAAHALAPAAGYVFRHADGTRSLEELTTGLSAVVGTPVDVRVTEAALWQLERANLLDRPVTAEPADRAISRRDAVRRFGAAALALATVSTIAAPTPAMARSVGITRGRPPHAGAGDPPPPHSSTNGPPPHSSAGATTGGTTARK